MRCIDRSMVSASADAGEVTEELDEMQGRRTPRDIARQLARENKVALLSACVILAFALAAIFAPVLTPYGYADMDLASRLLPPSLEYPLGTDEGGCDVLARMLYGSRISLLVGVVPTLLSMVVGRCWVCLLGIWAESGTL